VSLAPPTIQAGSPVYIKVKVYDETENPPASPPSPAPTAVDITLIDPTGAVQINAQAMTALTGAQAGQYTYTYPTTTLSPVGLWTMQFTVLGSGGAVQYLSVPEAAFYVVN